MKRGNLAVSACLGGFFAAWILMSRQEAARQLEEASHHAAWSSERRSLESALKNARSRPVSTSHPDEPPAPALVMPARPDAHTLLDELAAIRVSAGPGYNRDVRRVIHLLESLAEVGPDALPALREFLLRNVEVDYDLSQSGSSRGPREVSALTDFLAPPSLRFGLFDVVRRIGGANAESLFAEILGATARGSEVASLARLLEDMAPGKYRSAILAAARELLIHPVNLGSSSPIDQRDREYLFGVLAEFRDATYLAEAQERLILSDGTVDKAALKYLQQVAGSQSLGIVARAYEDSRLPDSSAKEPLVRLALSFVGADAQANAFYETAINDPNMPGRLRSNLIEDLNEDGLNYKNLSESDLPLIQSRITLIEQLGPKAMDDINAAAFKEAYKDLLKMRERITRPQPTKP